MTRVRHIFIDYATGEEICLPVSPSSWQWGDGNALIATNVDQLGAVNLAGLRTLATETVQGFFPSVSYPFCEAEAVIDPSYYIDWFSSRARKGAVLRYLITGTPVNRAVLIADLTYGQDDGSGRVNYTLTLQEYEEPSTALIEVDAVEVPRSGTAVTATLSHTVVAGDSLWALCSRYYGTVSTELCQRVATHNGLSSINIITVGQVLEFPTLDGLTTSTTATVSTASAIANGEAIGITINISCDGIDPWNVGKVTLQYCTTKNVITTLTKSGASAWSFSVTAAASQSMRLDWEGAGSAWVGSFSVDGVLKTSSYYKKSPTQDIDIVLHWSQEGRA